MQVEDIKNYAQLLGGNPEHHEVVRTEVTRESINDESVKQQIPQNCDLVEVIQGSNLGGDLSKIKIN
jgi:hypothetical protein